MGSVKNAVMITARNARSARPRGSNPTGRTTPPRTFGICSSMPHVPVWAIAFQHVEGELPSIRRSCRDPSVQCAARCGPGPPLRSLSGAWLPRCGDRVPGRGSAEGSSSNHPIAVGHRGRRRSTPGFRAYPAKHGVRDRKVVEAASVRPSLASVSKKARTTSSGLMTVLLGWVRIGACV
jgi:hypothetical protein